MKTFIKPLVAIFATFVLGVSFMVGVESTDNDAIEDKLIENNLLETNKQLAEPVIDEPSFVFHYRRDDAKYSTWGIHLWNDVTGEGTEWTVPEMFNNNDVDSYGAWIVLPISTFGADELGYINYIIHQGDTKDPGGDWKFTFADFTADSNGAHHIYLYQGISQQFATAQDALAPKIVSASFKDESTIAVSTTKKGNSYEILENETTIVASGTPNGATFEIDTFSDDFAPSVSNAYTLKFKVDDPNNGNAEVTIRKNVDIFNLFSTQAFEDEFTYDGELGAIYSNAKTDFAVWSPTAQSIKLRIYNSGTPTAISSTLGDDTIHSEVDMTKGTKGEWTASVSGDLEGKYYVYVITNALFTGKEVVDPYAKSAGINGKRGMIVDFSKTNPEGWEDVTVPTFSETETVIYETHVSDITSDPSWTGDENNRKKFLGLIEEGTSYTSGEKTVTTGFDHIKELGVNAIHLLPMFDHDNDEVTTSFNWGYNPLNYNVIEGSYSSNAYDGYQRIKEFKQVTKHMNENGIKVIMDVVYNHVSSLDASNFNILVPGYYYRYDSNGNVGNGSGCGNETASERAMFSKFIQDSTNFWLEEYKLGGFRFDLMGLHDTSTMQKVHDNLKEIEPNSIVYGEPWTAGTTPATDAGVELAVQSNISKMTGVAAFNDQLRNSAKGGYGVDRGWVTGASGVGEEMTRQLVNNLKGNVNNGALNVYSNPSQIVSYVTSHDNYTLHDQFKTFAEDHEESYEMMNTQAQAFALTAQGIGFVHAGEELMRSKVNSDGTLNENSYEAGYEVNKIDYSRKITYAKLFDEYKTMIDLKTKFDGLQYSTIEEVNEHMSVTFGDTNEFDKNTWIKSEIKTDETDLLILYTGLQKGAQFTDLDGYTVLMDSSETFEDGVKTTDSFILPTSSVLIAYKNANPIGGDEPANDNMALIIGLSIGAGVVLVGGIATGAIIFSKKKKLTA